ncbi:MAG TPA: TRAP transporter substrate-binding protein DctP [Thermoleophilaceae bacterium]|nr:TRAP transporter substrate-binding protein DctP [Thermoleophilaceae bacterium]
MRRKTANRRARPLLLAALAVLAVAGCDSADSDKAGSENKPKATVLTLANGNDDPRNLEPFAKEVERLSEGTLRIEFKNSWRAGDPDYETGVIRDVRAGKAELGWAGSRAFDDVDVASFDALHAPLLIDSLQLQRKVLESPLVREMLDGLEPLDLVGVGVLPGPMRKPLGVDRLLRPEDYEGRTVAFQRSRVARQTLEALGANAAEIPSAGAIDTYDGVEQQVSSIAGNAYDQVASYLAANVNLWPRPVVLFMNEQAFETLDDRQRSALRGAARAALPASIALERADEEEGATVLCRRGVRFVRADEADFAALRRAVQPVYERLERDSQTSAAITRIREMRSDAASRPDAPACSGPAPDVKASGKASPIDGVYRSDITLEQLSRTPGYDSGENHPGNVGHFRMELRKGRFRITGSSDGVDQEGTFALKGDILTFQWNGEGRFSYRWSLYRGALTLRLAEDGPTFFVVHPWRRVADSPSVGERTPIDGIYRLTTTREESAKAAGETPEQTFSENYGEWRAVFSRGQLRYTQASEGASRWTKAVYRVKGRVLTLKIVDYGGEAPNGAAEKTGEVFDYRWSLYRDRLTLKAVEGKISPAGWVAKPWRRVDDAP